MPGELLVLPPFSQVECSPLCGITWILGEDDFVVPEELTGDSEFYTIEETAVEKSEDRFSFVKSTLTLHEARNNLTQFSVSCRWAAQICHRYGTDMSAVLDENNIQGQT